MRRLTSWLQSTVDLQDVLIYGGLLCIAGGLALWAVPLGLAAGGILLFLLGVGYFAPKGGPS